MSAPRAATRILRADFADAAHGRALVALLASLATGEPATISHLKLYCQMMPSVAAGIWIIANLVGNHLLD